MEYVLEELLRQRRALAAVMTGKAPEERESSEAGAENRPETPSSGEGERLGMEAGSSPDSHKSLPNETERDDSREDGTAILPRESGTGKTGAMTREKEETANETAWDRVWTASKTGELPRSARFFANAGITGMTSDRMAAHWGGVAAETDAKALSRAIQRDARRYDGGFHAR